MKVLTVAFRKGGVAKTTTVWALADGLRRRGKSVLMVDVDPQGSLTDLVKVSDKPKASLYGAIHGYRRFDECIVSTQAGDLIPSSDKLLRIEGELWNASDHLNILQGLRRLRGYDYILIDTPPYKGVLTDASMVVSDAILIPSGADPMSYNALVKLGDGIEALRRETRKKIPVLGIVIVNVRNIKTAQAYTDILTGLASDMGTEVLGTVRMTSDLQLAQATGESLGRYRTSNATKDYDALTVKILDRME